MPRRAEIAPRRLDPDPVYDSTLVTQVINKVMSRGKKSTAEQIVYSALDQIQDKTGRPPVEVLEQAVKSVTPVLEVRSRRVGGATTRFLSRSRSAAPARLPCAGSWALRKSGGRSTCRTSLRRRSSTP
jgi:ribosomal protein S7